MATIYPVIFNKNYPIPQPTTLKELKKKCEINSNEALQKQELSPQLPKNFKVKQMASLFNSQNVQTITSGLNNGKYSPLIKKLPPEIQTQAEGCLGKDKAETLNQQLEQKSMFLMSEDKFAELTVRDKVQLYTQFINDMSRKNPNFDKHAEIMQANVKKELFQGEVVNEKQKPVKILLEELEARTVFPRQRISPLILQTISNVKQGSGKPTTSTTSPIKSKEFEDMPDKKVPRRGTVRLQSMEAKSQRRALSLPRCRRSQEETSLTETCHKRNNKEMTSSLPIEVYAPPKKIRRTGAEKLAPQIFLQNQQLENLFFMWLREKAKTFKEIDVNDAKSKSAINALLEQAIAELKIVDIDQKKTAKTSAISSELTLGKNKSCTAAKDVENKASTEKEEKENEAGFAKIVSDEQPAHSVKSTATCAKHEDKERHSIAEEDYNSDSNISETKTESETQYEHPRSNDASHVELSFLNYKRSDINSTLETKSAYSQWQTEDGNCVSLTSDFDETETSLHNKNEQNSRSDYKAEFRTFVDSYIDQGFETDLNKTESPVRSTGGRLNLRKQDTEISGPLFIKFSSNPSYFSTPIKECPEQPTQVTSSPTHEILFSPIGEPLKNYLKSISDTESRRSSLTMQVIREEEPLKDHEITSSCKSAISEACSNVTAPNEEKTSRFWIKTGDFSVALDIFYNETKRVRLLYEIFNQRSCDFRDLHFGIDNQKFSVHDQNEQENSKMRLPATTGCSYYWFSTGDLAIPFSGKFMSANKIQRLFKLIKSSVEDTGVLRFGVDGIEFSNVCEFWNQSPNFSMDSNYSLLVGLQSGNNNGLDGRNKLSWPRSKPVRRPDLSPTDFECEDSENDDSGRLSLSPFGDNYYDLASLNSEQLSKPRNSVAMMSGYSFGSLDDESKLEKMSEDLATPVPEIIDILKTQQERLSLVQEKISAYNQSAKLSDDDLNALHDTPHYLDQLKSIVAEIANKSRSNGFKDCTVQQLEHYMFFLSRYADICLRSCSDHMDKLLDALLDQKAAIA